MIEMLQYDMLQYFLVVLFFLYLVLTNPPPHVFLVDHCSVTVNVRHPSVSARPCSLLLLLQPLPSSQGRSHPGL